jgi:hypothetical protein
MDSLTAQQGDSVLKPLDINFDRVKKKKQQKIRHTAEIELSLKKNRFKLAEFFLLTMQNYDSAEVAYTQFIATYEDSIYTPKAYHALNYIYTFILHNPVKKDSIEQIILVKYPGSAYADFILKQKNPDGFKEQDELQADSYKIRYLQGEKELFQDNYSEALAIFNEIAVADSGGDWGEKARYATAWIYEHKLYDIPKAIKVYTIVSTEYPNTKIGKIARDKIKEPLPEAPPADSLALPLPADSSVVDSLALPEQTGNDEVKSEPESDNETDFH